MRRKCKFGRNEILIKFTRSSHEIRVVVIVVVVERERERERAERETKREREPFFFFGSERVNLGEISACSFGISVKDKVTLLLINASSLISLTHFQQHSQRKFNFTPMLSFIFLFVRFLGSDYGFAVSDYVELIHPFVGFCE